MIPLNVDQPAAMWVIVLSLAAVIIWTVGAGLCKTAAREAPQRDRSRLPGSSNHGIATSQSTPGMGVLGETPIPGGES